MLTTYLNDNLYALIPNLVNKMFNDVAVPFKESFKSAFPDCPEDVIEQFFSEMQEKAVSGNPDETISDELLDKLLEIDLSGFDLEKLLENVIGALTSPKITKTIESVTKERFTTIIDGMHANQIVISLNIIYLVCDALKIMCSSRDIKLEDVETVRKYQYRLRDLDYKLANYFYSKLDDSSERLSEMRERKGIDVSSLERKEQEERLRNNAFEAVFKKAIEELLSDVENQDADSLIKTRSKIQQEIGACPDCAAKENYFEWLDEISERLGKLLVAQYKDEESFDSVKATVIDYIGEKSEKLPEGTIDSLVTAEILYNKYANEEFASAGFEYSSISALYYQAFEEAYNNLIWKEYARKLNSLEVDGESFTDWLNKHHKDEYINDARFKGYLPSKINYRRNYIGYNKKEDVVRINKSCMFMPFAILMENIDEDRRLEKFCDYFATLGGYNSRKEMFSDDSYVRACKNFTNCLKDSVDHRNNASHGGTPIDMNRCAEDKKAVLNKVEMDRKENWGLIQQLLGLLQ